MRRTWFFVSSVAQFERMLQPAVLKPTRKQHYLNSIKHLLNLCLIYSHM